MIKYFAVSDIHSAYTPLVDALDKAGFDFYDCDHKLIICGDLFDRMSETKQVYNFIKDMADKGRLIYIRGNHEDLLEQCVKEIRMGDIPRYHHFSNGTVKTICQFCGESEWIVYDPDWRDKICETMKPILKFINENCVDYFEIGEYIFTHGYIPCFYHVENFRKAEKLDWERARWLNGMEMWTNPRCRIKGKTIVVGHWHSSWGHARIHHMCSEWCDDAIFEPFIDDGIIAIDACTAHTGKINCIVVEEK